MPELQENGEFIGEQRYQMLLQAQSPPVSPGAFEEDIRQQLLIDRLQTAVTRWVNVSEDELVDEHRRRQRAGPGQRRRVPG